MQLLVPTATAGLSVAVGAVAKGPSISSGRPATPEISCAFLAFQAARLKMGLTFEIDSPPVSAVLTTGVSAPAVPTVKPRTVKLNAVIDQTDETEAPVKTPATTKPFLKSTSRRKVASRTLRKTHPPNRSHASISCFSTICLRHRTTLSLGRTVQRYTASSNLKGRCSSTANWSLLKSQGLQIASCERPAWPCFVRSSLCFRWSNLNVSTHTSSTLKASTTRMGTRLGPSYIKQTLRCALRSRSYQVEA